MRRKDSVKSIAVLEAVFQDPCKARLVYLSMKPDEALKVKGLRFSSQLDGRRIVFKVYCRRSVMSLAYTLSEYLRHLKMIDEAGSQLAVAKYP